MSEYLLVCNFYNEELMIPTFLEGIARQTKKPWLTVLINDGSTDLSAKIAARMANKLNISYALIQFPEKKKGNLDTLGVTWTKVQPVIKAWLEDAQYLAVADVDNKFQDDYFERGIEYLERNPKVGVISGIHSGGAVRTMPMGGGKITRAEVIRNIDKYWNIAVDSFINIKALAMGYDIDIVDSLVVKSPPSHLDSWGGRVRQGRLSYYAGAKMHYVILRGLFIKGSNYLRGYWQEWSRGTWRTDDPDALEYYGTEFTRKIMGVVLNWRRYRPKFIKLMARRVLKLLGSL
jgi:glycosyltransferase involved in cell wall biosynthesis